MSSSRGRSGTSQAGTLPARRPATLRSKMVVAVSLCCAVGVSASAGGGEGAAMGGVIGHSPRQLDVYLRYAKANVQMAVRSPGSCGHLLACGLSPTCPDRPRQRIRQAVDIPLGPAFRYGDEQPALVLGVLAGEWIAGGDPVLCDAVQDLLDGRVEPDRELAHDGRVVDELNSVERGKPLARVGGAPCQ